MEMRLPFSRRRSRWDRLRKTLESTPDLRHTFAEAERLRDALPDGAELRRRVEPLVQRAASARQSLSVPEPPAFLQDLPPLDRLTHLGRKQPSATERTLNREAPLWLVIAGVLGGVVVGFAIGQALASRGTGLQPEALQAAAGQIKDRWPAVHDEDIDEAKGNLKRLAKVIGERTGENTGEVRERLTAMTASSAGTNGSGH
jgi:hypothetical protein